MQTPNDASTAVPACPYNPPMDDELHDAVCSAAARPEAIAAVERIYADVAHAVDSVRPRCDISGRCCRFEEYGHRLYVSTLELAAFVAGNPQSLTAAGDWDGRGCPFQVQKLCSVHAIRPFGCRMFFCDPRTTQWQNDAYEKFHQRLKAAHVLLNVPYFYVEWRSALERIGLARPAGDEQTQL